MNPELVIDMNLPVDWADWLTARGWPAIHWSTIAAANATDAEIMAWAEANNRVVFTNDLDYGTLLALTHAAKPNVLQIRSLSLFPASVGAAVEAALTQHGVDLIAGALITVEPGRNRVRVLPL
jgi:predicted nuclease of predicted toxin-antitoxin system